MQANQLRISRIRSLATMVMASSALMMLGLSAQIAAANTENVMHDFPDPTVLNDGANPFGALVQDPSTGNLYGTTKNGGKSGKGTVFCMTPSGSGYVVTILHSFSGPDGMYPTCALILRRSAATSGNILYGTTLMGGKSPATAKLPTLGTVFKVSTTGTGFAVVHTFIGSPNDGANPYAGVIMASDGNLYGTTLRGGTVNMGVTYKLKPTGGADVITHVFTGLTPGVPIDGAVPYARLFEFTAGWLVGTTAMGGDASVGTVFIEQLNGAGYTLTHTFVGGKDGANPTAELILAISETGAPMLYGTTVNGGVSSGGTAYRLAAGGGGYSVIYNFGLPGDGSNPWAGLFYFNDGNLYGTTRNGGVASMGTVFEMTTTSPAAEAVIHSFNPFGPVDDGANPVAALIFNPFDKMLYGTCVEQGENFGGTVYNIAP